MKFDKLVSSILKEDMAGDYKSLSTEDLIEVYKEEIKSHFTSDYGSYSYDQSDINFQYIHKELLSRGISEEELKGIQVEVETQTDY